ncbi:MAG: argininosuccinate lyase [Pseudomonadota bacterium]
MTRLWEKGLPLAEQVLQYTAGEDHHLDARLVEHDIRGSIGHARMLASQGYLSDADCESICSGLEQIGLAHARGDWHIELDDEDAHTAIENRLTASIGAAGGRLHLGRSRNDQVLTALRLYMRSAVDELTHAVDDVVAALDRLSAREGDLEIPGYTHMQQAMPSTVALWCGGFAEAFSDDKSGLEGARRRMLKNPLGSAAGYGTPGLELDRDMTTRELDFAETQTPVTAAQLSRGKAEAGLLFELTLFQQDLGRLASDLLLFYTQEFAYVTLGADATTGSSIMPQKRNPDVLELVRGASATAEAALLECLLLTSKLPSGFQRDVQRIKAPLFRSIDLALDSASVMAFVIDGMGFDASSIKLDPGLYATERAYALVAEEGIPFRDAYRRIAAEHVDD